MKNSSILCGSSGAVEGRWHLLRYGLALCLALTWASQSACSKGGNQEKLEETLIHEVQKGDLVEEIVESGKITPWYEVKVKTKVSGEVASVLVDEGEAVTRGQLLMELQDTDYQRQVQLAQTNYKEARIRVENAKLELRRNQSAFDSRGISKYELDRAKFSLDLEKVALSRAQVQLTTQQDALNYTKIYAPIDGLVTLRNVEPGELVTAGVTATVNGEPLLTLAQLDKLRLELALNQIDVARVKLGQTATVTLDAYRDSPIEGEVSSIAAAAHTDTSKGIDVFKVKLSIDPSQTDLSIKPGMTAEVRIHVGVYPQVVKVPIETVFEEDGKHYIFVVNEDPKSPKKKVKEKTEVTLGHKGLQEVEIAKGLQAGQQIYTKSETKDLELKL